MLLIKKCKTGLFCGLIKPYSPNFKEGRSMEKIKSAFKLSPAATLNAAPFCFRMLFSYCAAAIIANVSGFRIDHSFLKCKKELAERGAEVLRISLKTKRCFSRCQNETLRVRAALTAAAGFNSRYAFETKVNRLLQKHLCVCGSLFYCGHSII